MAQRIRRVESQKELEQIVDDFITQGYKVKARGEQSVNVKKSNFGSAGTHILIFIFLGWWTLFLANLIYALVANTKGDEVLVRLQEKLTE